MKTLLRIIALGLVCILFGCSDDNPVNDDSRNTPDRPSIPEPSSYAGAVPASSEKIIVETAPLSDYTPFVIGAAPKWDSGQITVRRVDINLKYYNHYFAGTLYKAWAPGDTIGIKADRKDLVVNGEIVTDAHFLCFLQSIPRQKDPYWYVWTGLPLSNKPYLQLIRYWVRIGDVERYSSGTSKTTTRTTTRGTTETSAKEFSKTLGIESTVSGNAVYVDLELKIKTEFTWTESQETSIMKEETFQESFTITPPDDRNIVYCVWQLYEEYRVVGTDGEIFTDPNFIFDNKYHATVFPTRELVPMTTYFKK
ncbi:MAG: hypothetical protein ACYC9O_08920 [Candidatus Latescibacterota bacterium]